MLLADGLWETVLAHVEAKASEAEALDQAEQEARHGYTTGDLLASMKDHGTETDPDARKVAYHPASPFGRIDAVLRRSITGR